MPKGINRSSLFETFSVIGERCSDPDGFVAMHALLDYFHAEIAFRPMLVEGAIAYTQGGRWRVYINSEQYPEISATTIRKESARMPLPPRLRFTIGHELSHISALSASGGNLDLKFDKAYAESNSQLEKALERLTDDLTALLLIPERALRKQLAQSLRASDSELWSNIRRFFGVSRPVLIHRLLRLQEHDPTDLRQHGKIRNRAFLLAEWSSHGRARLLPFPLYFSFEDGLAPRAVTHLVVQGETTVPVHLVLSGGQCTEYSEPTIFSVSPNSRGIEAVVNWSVEHHGALPAGRTSIVVLARVPDTL